MADKDSALAILQASIAIGGLLLVFIGFLLSRADQTDLKTRRRMIKGIAIGGLFPFAAALICSWQGVWVIQGAHTSSLYLFFTFKIVLALTGLYAIMATIFQVK